MPIVASKIGYLMHGFQLPVSLEDISEKVKKFVFVKMGIMHIGIENEVDQAVRFVLPCLGRRCRLLFVDQTIGNNAITLWPFLLWFRDVRYVVNVYQFVYHSAT
jgi:hypothetical protein